MKPFDLAFIGLGAAAMSLVTRLADSHYSGRVALIEPVPDPGDDRTWCGWPMNDHPFSHRATRRWSQWAVSNARDEVTAGSREISYEMLRSSDVRSVAMTAIAGRDDWVLLAGRALADARQSGDGWRLILDDQSEVDARFVLDARPPTLSLRRPWVWQSFVGVEVSGPRMGDADQVRLMDFVDDGQPVASFFYELPIDPHRRLIEFTRFTPTPADPAEMRQQVDRLINHRGWQHARVIRTEQGHLPMAPIPAYNRDQWIRIGTAGGSMRPATGYAFHAIQHWADGAAAALLEGHSPPPPARHGWLDWLDGVFLESLWDDPATASDRFIQLFRRVPPDALSRFLMARGHPLDTLKVLNSLPVAPMVAAAWRHTRRRS